MKFEIGSGVRCDLDELLISRLLVQANSGAGKSWALRRILEQTFGHTQQIVFDRDGEFVSLREKFDYVLAAKHGGDTVADPRFAKLLCRRLLELGASAILDISELGADERVRFMRLFLEAMIDAPKALWHPCLVVIDEVEQFCPEGSTGAAESAKAVEDLMLLGRKRGFCGVLATKRLARLRKSAAYECNNKLIGRCMLDDAKRAADELGFPGREGWQQFRELDRGEFYAFGPALTRDAQRVKVGPVQTTHPEAGQGMRFIVPPPTAKVRALLPKLEDLPAEAEQERKNIEDLKRDLATARRELTLAKKDGSPPDEAVIERRVAAAMAQASREHTAVIRGLQIGHTKMQRVITESADGLTRIAERLRASVNGHAIIQPGPSQLGGEARERPSSPTRVRPPPRSEALPDSEAITRPQQRILDALASCEALGLDAVAKSVVAVFSGASPTSGGYFNNLGALRSQGLIEYPQGGMVALTEAGRSVAEAPEQPPTLAALHDRWCAVVTAPQAAILRAVIELYPDDMSKDELAESIAVSPTSGGYFNNLGRLRTLGAIDYPSGGRVRATALLFPEGLA